MFKSVKYFWGFRLKQKQINFSVVKLANMQHNIIITITNLGKNIDFLDLIRTLDWTSVLLKT